jgi:hypothetical protein
MCSLLNFRYYNMEMYSCLFVRRLTNTGCHCQDGDKYGVMRDKADSWDKLSLSQGTSTVRDWVAAFTCNTPAQSSTVHFARTMCSETCIAAVNVVTLWQIFFSGSYTRLSWSHCDVERDCWYKHTGLNTAKNMFCKVSLPPAFRGRKNSVYQA